MEFVYNDLVDYAGSSDTKGMTIMSTYTGYTLKDNEYPWYTDNFNACTTPSNCYINVKVEDDKIYYLVPVLEDLEETEEEEEEVKYYGELEERVYTIEDSKLKYDVIKRYKIVDIAGQVRIILDKIIMSANSTYFYKQKQTLVFDFLCFVV